MFSCHATPGLPPVTRSMSSSPSRSATASVSLPRVFVDHDGRPEIARTIRVPQPRKRTRIVTAGGNHVGMPVAVHVPHSYRITERPGRDVQEYLWRTEATGAAVFSTQAKTRLPA